MSVLEKQVEQLCMVGFILQHIILNLLLSWLNPSTMQEFIQQFDFYILKGGENWWHANFTGSIFFLLFFLAFCFSFRKANPFTHTADTQISLVQSDE